VIIDDTDDRFSVGPSTIPGAGRGLFARAPMRAGDRLAVPGVLLRRGSSSDRCTSFADEYKFRAGDFVLLPCGLAALVNHSPRPNAMKVVEGEDVFLELIHDVKAGDEICFAYSDYALERWGSGWEG
jgi:hypothetical protein